MTYDCEHLQAAAERSEGVRAQTRGCQDCLASGSSWVHLRLCLECGHVGCCDSSPNRHASAHAHRAEHPVVRSYEPEEAWAFCYPDEAYAEELPAFPEEVARVHFGPRSAHTGQELADDAG